MFRYPGTIGLPKPLWITWFRPDNKGPDNARTTVMLLGGVTPFFIYLHFSKT